MAEKYPGSGALGRAFIVHLICGRSHRLPPFTRWVYRAAMSCRVELSRGAQKDLQRTPLPIVVRFRAWVDDVERVGLEEARKRPGYHDEPLRGTRAGQRSIRLNRAWRAIYVQHRDGAITLVEVREVNKHEY